VARGIESVGDFLLGIAALGALIFAVRGSNKEKG
jgi:hypothetical protein